MPSNEVPQQTQEAQVQEQVKGKLTFGIPSLKKPTPMWVTWAFRVEFNLNKAILMIFGFTHFLTPVQIAESIGWIAAFDYAFWGLGKFVGITKENIEKV